MRLTRVFAIAALGFTVLGSTPASPPPERFRLRMTVTLDSGPALTPELIVEAAREGTATDHGGGVEIRATASRVESPPGQPGSWVQVSMQVLERKGQGWAVRANPRMLVPLVERGTTEGTGEKATAVISDPSGAEVRLTLTASVAD